MRRYVYQLDSGPVSVELPDTIDPAEWEDVQQFIALAIRSTDRVVNAKPVDDAAVSDTTMKFHMVMPNIEREVNELIELAAIGCEVRVRDLEVLAALVGQLRASGMEATCIKRTPPGTPTREVSFSVEEVAVALEQKVEVRGE